ncbi:Clp protease N-terminal domain-containing protein [Thermoactinospora rubra]|uniref:Clp protease N-terminal domain-containing protein n=1 Tax=Thermoactinospora rubra TaxID=1088767 RepID=UPI000A0F839A|nr:Clp protease N-terminal domain-containing protein [Thermoactinospora rubra]
MFDRFTEEARQAFVRAGVIAVDAGLPALGTDALLVALAERRPFGRGLPAFTASPEELAAHLDLGRSRELLAALGIDLDEVRRRARRGADDPARWRLTRSRIRPLRVTLDGPLGRLPLTMHLRKAVEVALWRPGPVTGERLLWGLLADWRNGAAARLKAAGVDLAALTAEAGIPGRRASA